MARAKAALKGVTEGPWDAPAQLLGSPCTTVFGAGRRHVLYHAGGYTDAQFVAAARTLIPELVAEVERLRSYKSLPVGMVWQDYYSPNDVCEIRTPLDLEIERLRAVLADVTGQR